MAVVKEAEAGTSVPDLRRVHGCSTADWADGNPQHDA